MTGLTWDQVGAVGECLAAYQTAMARAMKRGSKGKREPDGERVETTDPDAFCRMMGGAVRER